MIRLFTLGALRLEQDGRPLDGPASQRHRLGFLALLAATAGHQVSRDRVLAMLWPDRSGSQGRTLLNTTVHAVRRAAGTDAIRSIKADLFLDVERIDCDVVSFLRLADTGADAEAARLYAGPFLDGFHLPGSEPFEEWLLHTRERLIFVQTGVLERLAVGAALRGDNASAIGHWQALVHHAPLLSRGTEGLMRAYADAGDRSSAIQAGERFAARLRTQLDVEPDASLTRLLASLRAAAPARAGADSEPAQAREPAPADHAAALPESAPVPKAGRTRWGRRMAAAALVPVLVLGAIVTARSTGPRDTEATRDALLIVPFELAGATEFEYLREGVVDLLAARLDREPGQRVVRPRAFLASWTRSRPADPGTWRSAGVAAARRFSASRVMWGEIAATADRLEFRATLADAHAPGRARVLGPVAGSPDSLGSLIDSLGTLLVRSIGVPDARGAVAAPTRSLDAWRWLLAGHGAYRRGAWTVAADNFERALTVDSTWAQAALGLALAENFGGNTARWERAMGLLDRHRGQLSRAEYLMWDALIGRALTRRRSAWREVTVLQPEDPEGWYELGDLDYHWGTLFDPEAPWIRARAGFARALEADSAFAPALGHLVELSAGVGDTAALRPLAERYFGAVRATDRTGSALAWLIASSRRDSVELGAERARLPNYAPGELRRVARLAQAFAIGLADADSALRLLTAMSRGDAWREAMIERWVFESNAGHPARADSLLGALLERFPERLGLRELAVLSYLYGEGNRTRAEASLLEVRRALADPGVSESDRWRASCTLAWWDGVHGRVSRLPAVAESLMAPVLVPRREAREFGTDNEVCARVLRALAEGGRGDRTALAELDEYLAVSGVSRMRSEAASLELVRLLLDDRDLERGLAVTRRRQHLQHAPFLLSAQLLRRARLAERAGNTPIARAAYQHYLALRASPEAGVARDEALRAASELAALPPARPARR